MSKKSKCEQTIPNIIKMFNRIVDRYCDKEMEIIKPNSAERKGIEFKAAINDEGHVVLNLIVRYGAFRDNEKTFEETHYKIEYIDEKVLTNLLFHGLVCAKNDNYYNPYYFEDGKFKKMAEVI